MLAAWRRRVHSATPSQIVNDRLPRCHGARKSRQVPSAGRPRIRALSKLPPSRHPKHQPDLCHLGKPLALRLPANHQATAPVSPGRHKSEQRGPAPRPGPEAFISFAPPWHGDCNTVTAQHETGRLGILSGYCFLRCNAPAPKLSASRLPSMAQKISARSPATRRTIFAICESDFNGR